MTEHSTAEAVHQAATQGASHSGGGGHHELANFIYLLSQKFHDTAFGHFLHRWENVIFSLIAAFLIIWIFTRAARSQNLVPRGIQNFCEFIVEGIEGFVTGILGERGREHVPFLGTLFVYILLMNWFGLIPFMKSSTASWGTTFALAIATTVYVQWTGIRSQGFGHYLKHIAGNPSNAFGFALIPLMLAINLTVEFLAVPISLSLRLFANVSSEDKLLFKFAELNVLFKGAPFFFQLFANVLAFVFSLVQAFVFMLLSTVYISLILPHDDHGHEDHHAHAPALEHAH